MRILAMLLALATLVLFALPQPSFAAHIKVSVTPEQVATVCGKNFDGTGCLVGCYGGTTCNFECHKGKCTGEVFSARVDPTAGKPPKGLMPATILAAAEAVTLCPTISIPGGCKIPCDPYYICQIFCGGRSYCAVGLQQVAIKVDPEPQNLGGTFSSPTTVRGRTPAGAPSP